MDAIVLTLLFLTYDKSHVFEKSKVLWKNSYLARGKALVIV